MDVIRQCINQTVKLWDLYLEVRAQIGTASRPTHFGVYEHGLLFNVHGWETGWLVLLELLQAFD